MNQKPESPIHAGMIMTAETRMIMTAETPLKVDRVQELMGGFTTRLDAKIMIEHLHRTGIWSMEQVKEIDENNWNQMMDAALSEEERKR